VRIKLPRHRGPKPFLRPRDVILLVETDIDMREPDWPVLLLASGTSVWPPLDPRHSRCDADPRDVVGLSTNRTGDHHATRWKPAAIRSLPRRATFKRLRSRNDPQFSFPHARTDARNARSATPR